MIEKLSVEIDFSKIDPKGDVMAQMLGIVTGAHKDKIQELIDKVNDIEITLELLNNKAISLEKAVKQRDRPIDWGI